MFFSSAEKFVSLHPDLFSTLGMYFRERVPTLYVSRVLTSYTVCSKEGGPSFTTKVKAELTRMEKLGVISKVDILTE